MTALGYIDQGRSRLDAALRVTRRLKHVYSLVFVLNRAVIIKLATGSPHEAHRHAEEMVALSNEHGFPFYLAWGTVHREAALTALGRAQDDVVNATGNQATVEQSYHQALAVARRQSAKLFELRAATSLARFSLNYGKPTEACDLLAPIYNWFTEGFDTPVLQEAKALLDELAS